MAWFECGTLYYPIPQVLPKAPQSEAERRAAEAPAKASKDREESDLLALKMGLWRILNSLLVRLGGD